MPSFEATGGIWCLGPTKLGGEQGWVASPYLTPNVKDSEYRRKTDAKDLARAEPFSVANGVFDVDHD